MKIKKTLSWLVKFGSWGAMGLGAAVLLAAAAFLMVPKVMGWQGVIVLSGSMEPTLRIGGIAFVEPLDDASTVKLGDIITFRSLDNPKNTISHRVIRIEQRTDGPYFETRGDNNPTPDSALIPPSNVTGKVHFHVPYVGYMADELRDRNVLYWFLGIPAALIIVTESVNIVVQLRRWLVEKRAAA